MANSAQAKKRARQADNRRTHKAGQRSMLRTFIKNVVKAVDADDAQLASEAYKKAVPVIDSMTSKGLLHKNKAARHKSRLNQHVRNMQS